MSGEYPFSSKTVSPRKFHEKPWDLWASEIGHTSPRPDDEPAFVAPPPADRDGKSGGRRHERPGKAPRYRRSGINRLRVDTMNMHGLFPQMDNLNAAVCHMCGAVVKCSAAYRHLVESHAGLEPLPPPPPPTSTFRNRSRHKKEPQPPPAPAEPPPEPAPPPPPPPAATPLSRLALPPQEMYPEEAGPSVAPVATAPPEVQVCLESGDLPVVSIQDTDELPLGETLTDDIFAIMNSEGIQTADDIANSADWKNIIRDIGNLQELTFGGGGDAGAGDPYGGALPPMPLAGEPYGGALPPVPLAGEPYGGALPPVPLGEAELAALALPDPPPQPRPPAPPPSTHRNRAPKPKPVTLREYDPNKHCGVLSGENPRPCTRSLTCKAHALSLRRLVEGRSKPFDTLLAEHRASREAAAAPPAPPPPSEPVPPAAPLPDLYAALAAAEPAAAPPPPLPAPPPPLPARASPPPPASAPAPTAADVCWYASCPRPLALCTFNAAHAAGAVTLGKRFATVRSNIKSSLTRSQCKVPAATNNFYYNPNALSLSKSVHMNASKTNKPEVRRLIVVCGGSGSGGASMSTRAPLNGHIGKASAAVARHKPPLELPFSLDPLLADEKC